MSVMPQTRERIRGEGAAFVNAVATTPTCCPSRASLMSGLYAHNHGVFHNQNNESELAQLDVDRLIAHQLSEAGYRTGLVGKFLNGWDLNAAPPDFDRYVMSPGGFFDSRWNINGQERLVHRYSTGFVGRQAQQFIEESEQDDERPWFLYVAPFAPHGTLNGGQVTLEPHPRYADTDVGEMGANPAREETSPAAIADKPPFWRNLVAGYEPGSGAPSAAEVYVGQRRMLLSVDDMIEGLFRRLDDSRESRRTLAVFVSDNGLFWGEHGGPPIKDMPYPAAVDIPLMMRWPGVIEAGVRDDRIAATIDLAPTLLDAANVAPAEAMDGRSLLRRWPREHVLLEYERTGQIPSWGSLYSPDEQQYSEYYSPSGAPMFREFYDFAADPFGLENVIVDGNPANDPNLVALSASLAAARVCAGASCP